MFCATFNFQTRSRGKTKKILSYLDESFLEMTA